MNEINFGDGGGIFINGKKQEFPDVTKCCLCPKEASCMQITSEGLKSYCIECFPGGVEKEDRE